MFRLHNAASESSAGPAFCISHRLDGLQLIPREASVMQVIPLQVRINLANQEASAVQQANSFGVRHDQIRG